MTGQDWPRQRRWSKGPPFERQPKSMSCPQTNLEMRSSGRSTATDEAPDGSSLSHRRCFAPPSATMACHPSGAQRSSLPASLLKSRSYRLDAVVRTAARTDSTVDSTSGAQKMACWSNVFCGSAAKRQPPLLSEVVRHRAGSFAGGQGHIVPLVPAIAAQPLPSYVRSFCFLGVRIGLL